MNYQVNTILKTIEPISNCCSAYADEDIKICSDCKEPCEIEYISDEHEDPQGDYDRGEMYAMMNK
jgi:hypothetical protein